MQNKANLRNNKMSANLFTIKDYEIFIDSGHEKTKPIQTQFKPKQTQNKANLLRAKSDTFVYNNGVDKLFL
jgi:hypothetical protein